MNELMVQEKEKSLIRRLNRRRLVMCILIIICILLICAGFIARNIYICQKVKKEEDLARAREEQIRLIQQEEEERERKRLEEEAAKVMARNQNDFTPEQVSKIQNIYHSSETKTAYLTFDDGPSTNVTPLILDTLKQENIKATFFVLGTTAQKNAEILKRIRTEGHYIANHGYSHKYSQIYANAQSILDEYNQAEVSIKQALGEETYKTRIFRFPGGSTGGKYKNIKAESKGLLTENNIAYLDWNALTCDAEGTPTKESIIENLKSTVGTKNNVVILMHDSSTKILTYETLPDVISYLKEQGYTFGDMYNVIGE